MRTGVKLVTTLNAGVRGLQSLFANGETGFLFDNMSDLTRLFTTSTGPTQVAANDDPVGLTLGNSKWAGKTLTEVMAAQPEKIVNGGFDADANWVKTQATISGGQGTVNSPDGSLASLRQDQTGLTVGATYRIQFDVVSLTAGLVYVDFSGASNIAVSAGTGTKVVYAVATASTFFAIKRGNSGAANLFTIDNVSIKEVPGNHAVQATTTARPLWKANSDKPYLNFDGTDDRIVTPHIPGAAGTIAAAFRGATGSTFAVGGGTTAGNKRCRLGLNASGYPEFDYNDQFTAFSGVGDKRNTDIIMVQTWDAATRECWADGVQLLSEARVSNLDGTGSGFALGSIESAASFLNGRVYAALALSRRATAAEIASITSQFQQRL